MSRRPLVWAPRLRLPPAKIGKSESRILLGASFGSLFARTVLNDLLNFAKFNFNVYTYLTPVYLSQDIIIKYTQYYIIIVVDQMILYGFEGPKG